MSTDEEKLRSMIGERPSIDEILRVFGGRDALRHAMIETLAGFEMVRRGGVQIDDTGRQMWAMTHFALLALDGLEGAEIVQRSLCLLIETLGASPQLTQASTLASDVRRKLAELAYGDPSRTRGPAS